jgi:hypothetical protein
MSLKGGIKKPRGGIYDFTSKEIDMLKKSGSLHPGNYKNMKIFWPLYLESHVSNVHVFNFRLVYSPGQTYLQKLYFNDYISPLSTIFAKANLGKKITNKRFIYIVLVINNPNGLQAHANGLLYDTKTQNLERFEPHGSENPLRYTQMGPVDAREIKNYLQDNLGLTIKTFYQPKSICPARGWQLREGYPRVENSYFNRMWKINGYCAAWTLYYIMLRASNPDVSSKKIQQDAFKPYEILSDYIHDFYYDFLRWKVEFLKKIT